MLNLTVKLLVYEVNKLLHDVTCNCSCSDVHFTLRWTLCMTDTIIAVM